MHKDRSFFVFRFTVEGNGHFPIDMLRYDRCVPVNDYSVEQIERINSLSTRKVWLEMYALSDWGPSKDRWASFGWTVIDVEPK